MAAVMIDIPYLSSYLSLPQTTLSSLVEQPTIELVKSVLQATIKRAKEHDEVKADKLRLEVELENTLRTASSKIHNLKTNLNKALGEVEQLRAKLTQDENVRNELEAQLQSIKSSATNSQSELQALRSRVSSLESSGRDTVSLLEAKSTAHDRLAEELTHQHQKTVDLRRHISELEQSLQAANAASTTAKFRESSLHQELELLKRNNDWLEGELKTKSAENSKSRKEKNAKISELQRQNEEARSNIDSLKRTEAALRTRLDEVESKADQSFAKIQQLQDAASRKQEDFRKELESAQRLAELFEASAKTARDRLQEVQTSLEQTKDEAAEDIGRVRAEVDAERAEKEAAERRVMELEVQIERLEADLVNMPNLVSLPGTPQRRMNGSLTPNRDVRGSPGASRLKGNLNFTQMYSEYTTTKAQLEVERRRNADMTTIIDEMIQDLETKQPEIEELRRDHERLQSEMMEMSTVIETASRERDKARKEARKWEGQVQGYQQEGELLRQQLRDLSTQLKVLLTELRARDEGLGALNQSQQMELERAARGEFNENALDDLTDTGRLISQRLTIFHNVEQLQEQNTKLLRLTRELGDRMEGDEAKKQQSQQAKDHEELEELRKKVKHQEDDLQSLMLRSDSYLKERDMFRRMLQHRGQLPPNSDFSSSEGPRTPGPAQSPSAKEVADMSKLLKEMQSHFDSYREEAATDHRALKEQSERLSKEKSELQAEVARSNSQVSLARERLEMLQSNYSMLKTENSELQKRSNALAENAAKQDLRTQQVAEDLVESKGLVDSLQKEIANLKAEKDLWKRIETRLVEDNEALVNERNRLNGLITNLQNLQNERELADAESRRKLQTQVENYTSELQSIKRKFDEEIEDSKKTVLRRELEVQQSQKKIDDLRTHLASVKEELVAAQTTRDHLQVRVEELTIELRSAEERIQALQPRATVEATTTGEDGASHTEAENERLLTREQELSVEVAELKRDLELAQSELRNAKDQAEQFKAISQSSEEELQSLNETYEQYRDEVDRLIAEKEAKMRDLEKTLEELRAELSNATSEISNLNAAQADRAEQADEEKANLEAEIARLNDEGERLATAAKSHQEDLKAQAEIAQQAQQNYESELLKHAEAAKALQEVRKEHNIMKTEIVQLRTDAEAARVALSQNESSWEETRERYEREIQEMRTRRDDVNNQNDLLHKQLEAVTSEIAALRQQRSAFGHEGDEPSTPGTASDRSIDELREVITFLRRDKEIVDVQYELSIQESKRLKQQLDYTQSQLDECRLRLDQERRNHAEGDRTSMTHRELLQKINELNLYRESTVTLRNEAREAQAQLAEKTRRVEELIAEIQPLRMTIQELENEKETREGEMKLLQDDRDRWQQRTQNILQKYDRVDPAELEALKEEISALRTEHAQLLTEKEQWQPLKEQVESIPQQIQKAQEEAVVPWRERQERQVAQFKERSRNLVAAKNEKIAECQQLAQEKEELERQLTASKEEVDRAKAQRDEALARVESLSNEQVSQNSQAAELAQTLSAEERRAMEERVAAAESAAKEQESRAQALETELSACQTRIAALELQIANLQKTLDEANARVAQLQALQAQASNQDGSELQEELEKLQGDLMNAQQEIDDLRTTAAVTASIRNVSPDDNSKTIAERISEQVGAIKHDLDVRHAERVQQAEQQYKQRADRMKTQLTKRLTDGKDQIRQNLEAEHNEAMEALKREHQREIEKLTAQHQQELNRVKEEEAMRFEQEKQIWLANNAYASSEPQQSNPASQVAPPEGPVSEWNFPEPQLREFARVNPIIQSILKSNINTQAKKVKDEAEEKLKEVMAKAEKEKEQAVAMEIQRQKVKLSMAEGKARTLAAKTDLVQKAAQETPQRPVIEVWELAKVAKAPPVNQTTPVVNHPSPAGTTLNGPQTGSAVQPNFSQPVFDTSTSPSIPQVQQQQPGPPMQRQPQSVPASNVFQQILPSTTEAGEQLVGTRSSSLPSKPPQSQFGGNAGTGPGALRSIVGQVQSMLPRAPGGMGRTGRGGNVAPNIQAQMLAPPIPTHGQNQNQNQRGQHQGRPRGGRNRGQARGAGGNMQNNQYNNQLLSQLQAQQGAPARQFAPVGQVGNKRQRDEGPGDMMGHGGNGGNGGKRPRSR